MTVSVVTDRLPCWLTLHRAHLQCRGKRSHRRKKDRPVFRAAEPRTSNVSWLGQKVKRRGTSPRFLLESPRRVSSFCVLMSHSG